MPLLQVGADFGRGRNRLAGLARVLHLRRFRLVTTSLAALVV
jgi:hypothetical protein